MNPYQSSLYLLTESVGAVSMVNTEQIRKQENLDYLEHLCGFIQRMNINPIWFENEETVNKLKVMEIYQLAINYSSNLAQDYRKQIEEKETGIAKLRKQEKEKVTTIRNQKDEYLCLKEKYKLKKHQMYKCMYDNLKHKIREEQEERDYRRVGEHRNPTPPPEIVYYYPNQNDPTYPYPHPQPYPPNYMQPPSIHSQASNPYANYPFPPLNPLSAPPTDSMSNQANNNYFIDINRPSQQQPQPGNQPESYRYKQFLNAGQLQQQGSSYAPLITTKDVIQASQERQREEMQKSNIIDSGDKLVQKMGKEVKKSQKSIKSNNSKKRESVRVDSREDDDQFGDLTVNSKKRDSFKAVDKNSDIEYDQEQFDSIAHIKLGTDSSAKLKDVAPNRFQSKIQAESPRAQSKPKQDVQASSNNQLNVDSSDDLRGMGFSSSIMHSKFSKGKQEPQVERLNQQPPKRNSQTIRKSNLPPEPSAKQANELIQSNQSKPPEAKLQPEKLHSVKPKRFNQPIPDYEKVEQTSVVQVVDINDQNFDIYNSNAGRVQSRKFQKPKVQDSVNIQHSNVGYGGSNNLKPEQKLHKHKPKRTSQIQSSILEVPESTPTSNNTLKVSVAESEEMRGSNMLYSQAVSMKFSKDQPSKTPPKLEKEPQEKPEEEDEYMDDFDDIDVQDNQLEKSHLPVSKNQPKPVEKSQVEINLSVAPTNKEITSEKYLKLANETFELKNNLPLPNKVTASVGASSNLGESDSFYDQIYEIPMNSRIAKRPSVIHRFSPSKVNKSKTVESLQKIPEERFPSLSNINSPSIHVIDPTGNVERVQERGVKEQERERNDKPKEMKGSKLQQFNGQSVMMKGKQTSLLMIDPPQIKQQNEKMKSDDDDEINFNLMEKSNIGNNSYQRQGQKKILDLINKIQNQPPTIRDARSFNDSIFDKILKERMKTTANVLKTPQKWEDVQTHFKKQLDKTKSELQQKRNEDRQESVSTPNSRKKDSFYDDLVYSQSNAKFQQKPAKAQSKKQQPMDPIKDMTESITIKDLQPLQQKPAPKPADNKYSRSNKPKTQVKNEIRKNINEGKNAYDVDDPLNVAAYQNKKLLESKGQDSDSDF